MALQNTFSSEYAETLEYNAKHNIEIEKYRKDTFDYDPNAVCRIPYLEEPIGLLEKMDPDDVLASAKALYEAYPNLSMLQASDRGFWAYLAHVDLYPYVRAVNKRVFEEDFNDGKYINEHFFYGFGSPMYHPLQGLWLAVKFTVEEGKEYPYRYTDYLFKDYGLRVTYLGRYKVFRNKEQVQGILDFMMANQEELFDNHGRQRYRWIIQHFNKMGATKQLMGQPKEFFIKELEKVKDTIAKIQSDEDVKNM